MLSQHTRWKLLASVLLLLVAFSSSARGANLKVWPLIDYRSDEATGTLSLHLLGPLISYERAAGATQLAVRPLWLFEHDTAPAERRLALLYPLFTAHWNAERTLVRTFGVLSFERHWVRHPTEGVQQRFTIFPLVFYRRDPDSGGSLSVLPLYANLSGFLGYERVRMFLFPAYLELAEPLTRRTWAPFPFVGWSGGTLGHGWRLWPIVGRQETGEGDRFQYYLWPLYIRDEHHRTRPEREVREVITPLYTRLDSPSQHSRTYGLFLTHTTNSKENTNSWGFPWPLWMWQTRLDSGETLSLRLAPFYQDRHQGSLHSRFYLWPIYRNRMIEEEDHSWMRRDFLLVVGRYSKEEYLSPPSSRTLSTLFPLWRLTETDDTRRQSVPALLDALFPHNETILSLYAPLWRLYNVQAAGSGRPHWSLLWDLVSSDGSQTRYPIWIGEL
jgi:hypothetical protein